VSRTHIEVEEGDKAGHVQCTASAYPEANYYWQHNHQVIGHGPRLLLDYGLGRDKTGEYVCVAHNQHGNSTAKTYIDVVCKCSVSETRLSRRTLVLPETRLVVGTRLTFRTPLVALVTPSHVLASH